MDEVPCNRCGPAILDRGGQELLGSDGKCTTCKGTGFKFFGDKQQTTAVTKLLGKLHPDLASKTIDKVTRKVVFGRMNAMSDDEKAEIAEVLDVAKDDGTYEES